MATKTKGKNAAQDTARTITLQIRLSEGERAVFDAAAASWRPPLPTGTWIRMIALEEVQRIKLQAVAAGGRRR
jgi:hypothetical protein